MISFTRPSTKGKPTEVHVFKSLPVVGTRVIVGAVMVVAVTLLVAGESEVVVL